MFYFILKCESYPVESTTSLSVILIHIRPWTWGHWCPPLSCSENAHLIIAWNIIFQEDWAVYAWENPVLPEKNCPIFPDCKICFSSNSSPWLITGSAGICVKVAAGIHLTSGFEDCSKNLTCKISSESLCRNVHKIVISRKREKKNKSQLSR